MSGPMAGVRGLSWAAIVRLGLVQTALGAIVVLTTSTLNRVMVVELALPAMLPGALVALHFAVQILRPRWGHASDLGGRRTPWIIGGMAVLACGGALAGVATVLMATSLIAGVALAVIAFLLIGAGVGAAGTSLLVLLAKRVEPRRRAAAATTLWVMMILGFIVTATVVGKLLDPFSLQKLVAVTAAVSLIAFALTIFALWGIEGAAAAPPAKQQASKAFRVALREVWADAQARRFTIFVFVSMLAYSAQDLILEPFAGQVFGMTPGESTALSGVQHAGVLMGMLLVGFACSVMRWGATRAWIIGGCVASAIALLSLSLAGMAAPHWPFRLCVFALGVANGAFAVASIGEMMALAGTGGREGVRMGLWGAAQAIAFGVGGFAGTVASDAARALIAAPGTAYAVVFAGEALLFIVAAALAFGVSRTERLQSTASPAARSHHDGLAVTAGQAAP